jgi:toxin CcdB
MPQFDIYRATHGFNLDVQTDLIAPLNTRLVVPLMPRDVAPRPEKRLNPVFTIEGQEFVMVTQYLSAVRVAALGPPVGSLDPHYDEIRRALDMIFLGF